MKIAYSWLCDFAPFDSLGQSDDTAPSGSVVSTLVDAMNDLGLVVEGVEQIGQGLDNVVVAQVVEIDSIAGADKIRRVKVKADEDELIQIVCGAMNFGVGDKVPLAKIGAVLPGDFIITKRRMKGVESFGMLCSPIELRVGTDQSGLMILPESAEVGHPLADFLGIVPDVVFDLAIENNRPDANCVLGVARDLAAWFKLPFAPPVSPAIAPVPANSSKLLSGVSVSCEEQCDRLVVAVFNNLTPSSTPEWIARRLTLCGMRPVSAVVDISNYLMLELGQPSHPYDVEELQGGFISVRLAEVGEILMTLDGTERILGLDDARGRKSTDVVITDGNNKPVGLAGIMGGKESEIKESTSSVLLEIAHFQPMTIARTSKRLGLRSEASARFERGVDPAIIELTLARFVEILGQQPIEVVEISSPSSTKMREVDLRITRVNEILGTSITSAEVCSLLAPLGFEVSKEDEALVRLRIPTNRVDVEREIDVIEEVARHYGYRRIEKVRPNSKIVGSLKPLQRFRRKIEDLAVGMGFYEAWSATLLAPGEQEHFGDEGPFLEVENPLAKEESVLRRSLLPGLIRAVRFNLNRRERELRLFEIGKVFSLDEDQIIETERVAFLLGRNDDGAASAMSVYGQLKDYFGLLDVTLINHFESPMRKAERILPEYMRESWHGLHPTRSGLLVHQGVVIGMVGDLDPMILAESGIESEAAIGYLELDLQRIASLKNTETTMKPISQFPAAQVDLAFEVDESVSTWEIEKILNDVSPEISSAKLFDVFRGESLSEGSRSLAFSVIMSSGERTLSDADISAIRADCIRAVESRFRAKLRS